MRLINRDDMLLLKSAFFEHFVHGELADSWLQFVSVSKRNVIIARLESSRWQLSGKENLVLVQPVHCVSTCRLPINDSEYDPYYRCVTCFRW